MGSYVSSLLPNVYKSDTVKIVDQKRSQIDGGYFSSFWPFGKRDSLKCNYCESDLPSDGAYSTCRLCQRSFHYGKCSAKQTIGHLRSWTCSSCITRQMDNRFYSPQPKVQKAPKYQFPYTDDFPPPKRLRHIFRTTSASKTQKPPPPPKFRAPTEPPPKKPTPSTPVDT